LTPNEEYFESNPEIEFYVNDQGAIDCKLYLKEPGEEWYILQDTISEIENNKTQKFLISNITGKQYYWKIECIDEEGNSEFSEEKTFQIFAEELKLKLEETENAESEITQAIKKISSFGKEEKEASSAIKYEELLQNAKKEIVRAKRDINNIVYRKDLSQDEKIAKQQELENNIKDILKNTPRGLKVISSKSFVSYPDETQIISALEKVNQNPSKNLIQFNKELQESITVTTNIKTIELEYEEKTEKATIVQKVITYNEPKGNNFLLEIIPKTFAQSSDDLVIITEHEVIEKDPVLRFGLEESITYYVKQEKTPEIIEDSATIIISTQEKISNSPTGFSINKLTEKLPINSTGVMAVIIALVLIAGLFAYKFGLFKKIKSSKEKNQKNNEYANQQTREQKSHESKTNLQENTSSGPKTSIIQKISKIFVKAMPDKSVSDPKMEFLLRQAFEFLGSQKTQMAMETYTDISNHYSSLNYPSQQKYLPQITELCHSIDTTTIKQLMDSLEYQLATGNTEDSMKTFNSIENIYSNLPETYKNQVGEQYFSVYNRIEEIRSIILNKLRFQDE